MNKDVKNDTTLIQGVNEWMPRNERKYKIFYYMSFKYQQHMYYYADYTYQETSELKKSKPQNIIFQ